MSARPEPQRHERAVRVGIVVHPTREIEGPLSALRRWADAHGVSIRQVQVEGRERKLAEAAEPGDCDLIVAIGGDGTALAAIHAAIGDDRPVLGVACGSLGALTTVPASGVAEALERFSDNDWTVQPMPALRVVREDRREMFAVNDIAIVRAGEGQTRTAAFVDGTMFARFAGDGCIVSTPIGSSAYALAAGGPLLAPGADAFLLTPLSAHGGFCPPLVLGGHSRLRLEVTPGHGGARLELDGQVTEHWSDTLEVSLQQGVAQVVAFAEQESFLSGLRQRQIIIDSPRILADDTRAS